ncbi:MAG: FG-GAP repeat protein, partial [Thermoplasmata archaeon]|nr:FG-GAP repeat protein [Thermoplasmata archaeon]
MKAKLTALLIISLLIASTIVLTGPTEGSDFKMDADLKDSHASFIGEDVKDNSSRSVSGAGDVNGDGYDDILIGAFGDDDGGSDAGQTYLIFGKASGWTIDQDLSTADASFIGEDAKDNSSYSVSSAGDVNGDGYDDILIGAFGDDDGGSKAGQTYLIFGKVSGWIMDQDLSTADASFIGEDAFDYSGYSVSGAGDVNGDGYEDILIGAYRDDDGGSKAGQTYLILGKASSWSMDTDLSNADASFIGEDTSDESGNSVSGAGDVNGDGYDDILIGAHYDSDGGSDAGQTYLILGKASGWSMDTDLSNADASFIGEDTSDQSGYSVSGAGDVNGDGYDDLIIGATRDDDGGSEAGQTYLILGKSSGWSMDIDLSTADASFIGESVNDFSGETVSGAGDVNADGYDDILIGSRFNDDGGISAGQTYLILGKFSGWSMDTNLSNADASFIGENRTDNSGRPVSGAGDVNGDGYDDILIGAPYNDDGGRSAGKTYLIFNCWTQPAPIGLQANLLDYGNSIELSWMSSIYWNEPIIGYRIYRSVDALNYENIAFSMGKFFDHDVELGTKYYYSVKSVDGSGDLSSMSRVVSILCELDSDNDGIGNSFDDDDDGDNIPDRFDRDPLVPDGMSWTTQDVDLENWGIGFIGEDAGDESGFSVSDAGDVNGDGFDDMLIGAHFDEDGGSMAGQTYLILGKASGWDLTDLSNADASFIGEDTLDRSGRSVSGAGDVNGDGYDDILIGAWEDDDGGTTAGQTYLILGKASGWAMDQDLSAADASFWGEDAYDRSGYSVSGAGDVNGDGYDDIL